MPNFATLSSDLPLGFLASLLAFNIFLSFAASLGNVLILLALNKVSSLNSVTKRLFRCLAMTDLCVGLLSQPLFVAGIILDSVNTEFKAQYYLREIIYISSYVLCGVSMLISTAISVDRLLVLMLKIRYRQVVTLKRAQAIILLSWLTAVSCGLLRVWSQTVSKIVVFVASLASLATSVFCYVKIYLNLQRRWAEVEDTLEEEHSNVGEEGAGATRAGRVVEEETGSGEEGKGTATEEVTVRTRTARGLLQQRFNGRVELNIEQYKKTVSSIFWVQLALVACFAPFVIVSILRQAVIQGEKIYGIWLFTATLVYLNSSLNPFLYCWRIREVRIAVKNTNIIRAFCDCL